MAENSTTQHNTLHWSPEGAPISSQFDDVYFSTDDGLAESRYVFLQHNQLDTRFQQLDNQALFTIAEMGFGTGLNFLAVWELWAQTAPKEAHLHFISVEKFPLTAPQIQQALSLWPSLAAYASALIQQYPITTTGFHRIHFSHNVSLTLIIGDACSALQQLLVSNHLHHQYPQWQGIDAWLLDGFTPAKNPDMWTNELFATMATLSHQQTTLATFTAASHVRRGLEHVGFEVSKDKGFGLKREMLMGRYQTTQQTSPITAIETHSHSKPKHYDNVPWMVDSNLNAMGTPKNKAIAIIGGGLAGCHTAHALARRGYSVTIFDQGQELANGASGNAQGIVYGKLSPANETLSDFNHQCLLYAQRFYADFWHTQPQHGSRCGVLQLSHNENLKKNHRAIAERLQQYPDYVRYVHAQEASRIANTRIEHDALFFPQLGWLEPAVLCQWLSQHDNIRIVTSTHIEYLEPVARDVIPAQQKSGNITQPYWRLGNSAFSDCFHTVIIANAHAALQFGQTQHLPIKAVRGQVTHLPVTPESVQLSTVVCGKGYIAPATKQHCLGASFNLHSQSKTLDPADHLHNLQQAAQQTPELISPDTQDQHHSLAGRVGFRCATADYLPIVGPAPIYEQFIDAYQPLIHNAKANIDQAGHYYPNLYTHLGHGSRGLTYAPMCAEVLASLIHQEPPPIAQILAHKLSPARFIIRNLIRKKSLDNSARNAK